MRISLRAHGALLACRRVLVAMRPAAIAQDPRVERAAQDAARAWLAMTDRDDGKASWDAAGKQFQAAITADAGSNALHRCAQPLGAVVDAYDRCRRNSCRVSRRSPRRRLRDAAFRTSFANKADADETVTLERESRRLRGASSVTSSRGPRRDGPRRSLAQQKFACPACGAEAIWNPAKQALVCPFCGTTSPAKLDADTGGDRRARPRRPRCAASATTSAAGKPRSATSNARAARRSRCSIRNARRSAANSAARRSSFPTSKPRTRFAPRACCRSRSPRTRRATASARGTASCGSRPTRSSVARSPTPSRASTCRTGPSTRTSTRPGPRKPATTTTRPKPTPTAAAARRRARCSTCAGSRRRDSCTHFFDDDLDLRVGRRARGVAARHRAVSDHSELKPYDAGYVAGWVVERYQIDLVAAAQAARDAMDAKLRQTVRGADSRRHLSQSRGAAPTTRARPSSTSSRRSGC